MKKMNKYGISHLVVPVLAFVLIGAIGGMYLLLKGHAAPAPTTTSTTTATPDAVASNFHICLNAAQGECLVSNGNGKQISTKTSGAATWKQISTRYPGEYTFQNNSGNCLSVAGSWAIIASGSCNENNSNELWRVTTNPFQLKNDTTQKFLALHGTGSLLVSVHDPGSGWYESWDRK